MNTTGILKTVLAVSFVIAAFTVFSQSQAKPSIAVVSIDTKGLSVDNETMSNIVRLELEKIDKFEVLDKYDVTDIVEENDIIPDQCFGKNKVIKVGTLLKSDKMLTGSAEKFGEKIIVILRLIDVSEERVETTSVMEYLNVQSEIQTMVMISLNELLGIPNDPHLVDLLINYNLPITSTKTTVNLTGPRIGATYALGDAGKRLQASKNEGGYNMFPITSMFGYQFEQQYLSSGDFQALIELIGAVNGLESGNFIPSVTFMNGFRFNNTGFEFGIGPVFRLVKVSDGYYNENDQWVRLKPDEEVPAQYQNSIEEAIDHRGTLQTSLGLVVAIGRTFRSGYLNVPVNAYLIPRKEGTVVGLSFGFNTSKRPKL